MQVHIAFYKVKTAMTGTNATRTIDRQLDSFPAALEASAAAPVVP